jgi:NADP-dependent 3-hydroxy acid dehydrogenase YdfG
MGCEVVLACRSIEKAKEAIEWLKNNTKEKEKLKLVPMELDLSDLLSIYQFSKQFLSKYNKLDILMNNAGQF